MEDLLKIVAAWDRKTLEDLRSDAVLEESGNAFAAVRVPGGPRMVLAVCATGYDQIERMRQDLGLTAPVKSADWNTVTLGDLVMRAAASPSGLVFEPLSGAGDEWLALVQVAVVPDSIRMLESGFGLES